MSIIKQKLLKAISEAHPKLAAFGIGLLSSYNGYWNSNWNVRYTHTAAAALRQPSQPGWSVKK